MKTAAAAAAIGTFAALGAAEAVYESILNIKTANKVAAKFHLEDEKMMEVLLNAPLYVDGYRWFDEKNLKDVSLISDSGVKVHGYVLKNPDNTGKWAVCSHGYRGDARAEAPYAKHLFEQGYSIVFPQMRAHEHDENRYCSMGFHEKHIIIAWIQYLVRQEPGCRILLHGVSMGAASVMLATGEKLPENVKCAVADCGYSSCWDIFSYQIEKAAHIPAAPILTLLNAVSKRKGNFDFKQCSPKDAVAHSETPTLFIHGMADEFVPYAMSEEVFLACSAEKEKLDIPGAVHAAAAACDAERYFQTMDAFTAKYL